MKNSVLSMAPLRISFAGGGTDLPEFYERHTHGMVVSSAINKYVYVHLKRHDPTFSEKYRISYSEIEHCNSIEEIRNVIVAACLRVSKFTEPLQISTSADIPAHSGLGSSSSFAVALLAGIHELRGDVISKAQLAEEAYEAERFYADVKCGKQDHYAAAFGGLNSYTFYKNGNVSIEPVKLQVNLEGFLNKCILIWSGQSRQASEILLEQSKNTVNQFDSLLAILEDANKFRLELVNKSSQIENLISIINSSWQKKKNLSSKILNAQLERIIKLLESLHAGIKVAGAGGGGFVMCLVKTVEEIEKISDLGLNPIRIESDYYGSRSIGIN